MIKAERGIGARKDCFLYLFLLLPVSLYAADLCSMFLLTMSEIVSTSPSGQSPDWVPKSDKSGHWTQILPLTPEK